MNCYVSLFPGGQIVNIVRYGRDEAGAKGSVARAVLTVADQTVRCMDNPVKHAFTVAPAFSFFVDCESEAELLRLWGGPLQHGVVPMALGAHGFSRQFGWLNDRYGVLGPAPSPVGGPKASPSLYATQTVCAA